MVPYTHADRKYMLPPTLKVQVELRFVPPVMVLHVSSRPYGRTSKYNKVGITYSFFPGMMVKTAVRILKGVKTVAKTETKCVAKGPPGHHSSFA